jgi:hypothetical protein
VETIIHNILANEIVTNIEDYIDDTITHIIQRTDGYSLTTISTLTPPIEVLKTVEVTPPDSVTNVITTTTMIYHSNGNISENC